jgi:hypothetical protein
MRSISGVVLACMGVMTGLLMRPDAGVAQTAASKPRLLVLPWVVIDRSTNKACSIGDCPLLPPSEAPALREAQKLAQAAQAALDAAMHQHGMIQMIRRKEWEPHWKPLQPTQVVKQGSGCAVCTPTGSLLRYDRAAVQELGRSVAADYVWLGTTVVPLTRESVETPASPCCREALALERKKVLARSSALLVRVKDGETVWQRDARELDQDVPRSGRRVSYPPERRREYAVKETAHTLGKAFGREHRKGLVDLR